LDRFAKVNHDALALTHADGVNAGRTFERLGIGSYRMAANGDKNRAIGASDLFDMTLGRSCFQDVQARDRNDAWPEGGNNLEQAAALEAHIDNSHLMAPGGQSRGNVLQAQGFGAKERRQSEVGREKAWFDKQDSQLEYTPRSLQGEEKSNR
jgi:hypothetical protein